MTAILNIVKFVLLNILLNVSEKKIKKQNQIKSDKQRSQHCTEKMSLKNLQHQGHDILVH